jgi:hypothetical protein
MWGAWIVSEGGVPLLSLEVAIICALDLARLHKNLRRRAIDAFLEPCVV